MIIDQSASSSGMVYLVGAGPGDPDLLTVKAHRLLKEAEVVVFDRLISKEIMALVNPHAERIFVGKQESYHFVPQEQINQMLCDLAKQGKQVIRLKGGDPFMFGRGGEEIEALANLGIHYEIVPGITAATGCSAYAGIPLTHRDHAQSVHFITGHLRAEGDDHDWQKIANPNSTLVFYMGLKQSSYISKQLMEHGLNEKTPCAVIEGGTSQQQRVMLCELYELPEIAAKAHSPGLIVVGKVSNIAKTLGWHGRVF